MATNVPEPLTPEEQELQAAQDREQERQEKLLAERIVHLPEKEEPGRFKNALRSAAEFIGVGETSMNRSQQLESMIRTAATALGVSDEKMDKFATSIREKVEAGEKAAAKARRGKVFKDFKGRFQLLDGKWFPAGLHRDAKITVKNKEVMGEVNKLLDRGVLLRILKTTTRKLQVGKLFFDATNTLPVEDLDRVVNRYAELDQAMERNKDRIKHLKTILKSSKEWEESKQRHYEELRAMGIGVVSAKLTARSAVKQMEEDAKALVTPELEELMKKEKTFVEEKKAIDAVLNEVKALQDKAKTNFKKDFGPEIALLKKGSPDYQEQVEQLRERVRRAGSKLNAVYYEVFLNEELGLEPIQHTEAEMGTGKEVYKEPANEVEQKKELVAFGKWWRNFFGSADVPNPKKFEEIIKDVRLSGQRDLLRDILKDDVKGDAKEILEFFFKGTFTSPDGYEQKLDSARLEKPFSAKFVDVVKKIPVFLKKAKGTEGLRKAFWLYANANKTYKLENFERVIAYPDDAFPTSEKERLFRDTTVHDLMYDDVANTLSEADRQELIQERDQILLGNFPASLKKEHAEAFAEMRKEDMDAGTTKLEDTVQVLVRGFNEIQDKFTFHGTSAPLTLDAQSLSASSVYRELAEQYWLSKNPGNVPAGLPHGDPRTEANVQQMILHQRFGRELARAWKIPAEKPKVEHILTQAKIEATPATTALITGIEQLLNQATALTPKNLNDLGTQMEKLLEHEANLRTVAVDNFMYEDVASRLPLAEQQELDQTADQVRLGNFPVDMRKCAEAFAEMEHADASSTPHRIPAVMTAVQAEFDDLVDNISLGGNAPALVPGPKSESTSWLKYEFGRQHALGADPLTNTDFQSDLAHQRLGWEVYAAWNDTANPTRKANLEILFAQIEMSSPSDPLVNEIRDNFLNQTATTDGNLDYQKCLDLGKKMEELSERESALRYVIHDHFVYPDLARDNALDASDRARVMAEQQHALEGYFNPEGRKVAEAFAQLLEDDATRGTSRVPATIERVKDSFTNIMNKFSLFREVSALIKDPFSNSSGSFSCEIGRFAAASGNVLDVLNDPDLQKDIAYHSVGMEIYSLWGIPAEKAKLNHIFYEIDTDPPTNPDIKEIQDNYLSPASLTEQQYIELGKKIERLLDKGFVEKNLRDTAMYDFLPDDLLDPSSPASNDVKAEIKRLQQEIRAGHYPQDVRTLAEAYNELKADASASLNDTEDFINTYFHNLMAKTATDSHSQLFPDFPRTTDNWMRRDVAKHYAYSKGQLTPPSYDGFTPADPRQSADIQKLIAREAFGGELYDIYHQLAGRPEAEQINDILKNAQGAESEKATAAIVAIRILSTPPASGSNTLPPEQLVQLGELMEKILA